MGIEDIHGQVLAEITTKGIESGVELYRKHEDVYNSLPQQQVAPLWKQILEAIEKKEGFSKASMLAVDDPFMLGGRLDLASHLDHITVGEVIEYRESFYRTDEQMTEDMFNYALGIYQAFKKMIEDRKNADFDSQDLDFMKN